MPSLFEQLLSQQTPALRDAFGTPDCIYQPPRGADPIVGLTLRIYREPFAQGKTSESQQAEIIVLMADLSSAPLANGRFTVPGDPPPNGRGPEVWSIVTTPLAQNGEYVCTCIRTGTTAVMSVGRAAGGNHG